MIMKFSAKSSRADVVRTNPNSNTAKTLTLKTAMKFENIVL